MKQSTKVDFYLHQKMEVWSQFCSNDYPYGINSKTFLKIILVKVKKTYHQYVRFYCQIDWVDTSNLEERVKKADRNFEMLFNRVQMIIKTFTPLMRMNSIQKEFIFIRDTIESTALNAFQDYASKIHELPALLEKYKKIAA